MFPIHARGLFYVKSQKYALRRAILFTVNDYEFALSDTSISLNDGNDDDVKLKL